MPVAAVVPAAVTAGAVAIPDSRFPTPDSRIYRGLDYAYPIHPEESMNDEKTDRPRPGRLRGKRCGTFRHVRKRGGAPVWRARRARSSRSGFTLVEACVSVLILGLVFAGLLAILSAGRKGASLAENRLAALHIARQEMEGLRLNDFFSPTLSVGAHQLPGGRGRYSVVQSGNGWTKDITLVVDWQEPAGAVHSVSLTTSFSRSLHR